MNFELTEEQQDIQDAAGAFLQGELDKDKVLQLEKEHAFPRELLTKAGKLGFMGIHFPEAYGGQGYGIMENILVVEEFCRNDSGVGIALSLADFSSELILKFGSEEQKKKYLPPICRGEMMSAGAYTEPDHGSDITTLGTTAVKDGDDYVINGTKTFITNGSMADVVVVLCQTDPKATPGYRGQSTLIVEKGAPGLEALEIAPKMGIHMTSTAELSFNSVRVPANRLLGVENKGFYQVLNFFDESRIEIAAQALGIAQGVFDRALSYTTTREQFGKKISDFQAVSYTHLTLPTKRIV